MKKSSWRLVLIMAVVIILLSLLVLFLPQMTKLNRIKKKPSLQKHMAIKKDQLNVKKLIKAASANTKKVNIMQETKSSANTKKGQLNVSRLIKAASAPAMIPENVSTRLSAQKKLNMNIQKIQQNARKLTKVTSANMKKANTMQETKVTVNTKKALQNAKQLMNPVNVNTQSVITRKGRLNVLRLTRVASAPDMNLENVMSTKRRIDRQLKLLISFPNIGRE